MRIVIFTEVFSPNVSGISSYVEVLKNGLEKLKHQVLIVTSSLHTKRPVFKNGIIRCPARKCNNKYGYECKNINDNKTIEFIKSFKPDIVHIQTDTRIGYMGIYLADKINKPVVFTIHDYYIDRFASSNSKIIWNIKTMIEKQHFKDMIDNADILTSSCRRASMFVKNAGRERRVVLIPSNTDTSLFDYRKSTETSVKKMRKKLGLASDSSVAVFAGKLTVEKNLEFVLTTISKYITPDDNIQFLIVGDGTETDYLKSLCRRLHINNMVRFIGSVAHSIMPEIYSSCDIYVCSYDDGLMSMSFSEAIACGLPVLIKEDNEKFVYNMIQNGINGFVYTNEYEFAKYLKKLSSVNQSQKNRIKHVVRHTISNTGNIYMCEKYVNIYRNAIRIRRLKNFT